MDSVMTRGKKDHDVIDQQLTNLTGAALIGRVGLSEAEKDRLVVCAQGPRTVEKILLAQKTLPLARIPFLFSAVDSQAVADILVNDMNAAVARALVGRQKRGHG